jgi:lipopolysaccharide biosynthesis glycosyltransferase
VSGEGFQSLAIYSITSYLMKNPGIKFHVIFLDTEPLDDYKALKSMGMLYIHKFRIQDFDPPKCNKVFQVFWFRYVIAPTILPGRRFCHTDSDIICIDKLPLDEILEGKINACIDVSMEASKKVIGTLSSYSSWVNPSKRRVYINAGLIFWDKLEGAKLFESVRKKFNEDSSLGVVDRAVYGDQAYINAAINEDDEILSNLNILPRKWNIGIWEEKILDSIESLHKMKKALLIHVFSQAKDRRDIIIKKLFEDYVAKGINVLP